MRTRDFVVLAYGAFGGEISGKTNLQKKVYFLGVGLGKELDLGYRPHYYGPYSAEVAEANSELRSMGYLSECATSWGSDNRGFEIARYDYALTQDGKSLLEKKKQENPNLWSELSNFAKAMEAAGDLNYWELSIAAKAYFILKSAGAPICMKEIQDKAWELGWEVRKEEIQKTCAFLEKVGLVELSC